MTYEAFHFLVKKNLSESMLLDLKLKGMMYVYHSWVYTLQDFLANISSVSYQTKHVKHTPKSTKHKSPHGLVDFFTKR